MSCPDTDQHPALLYSADQLVRNAQEIISLPAAYIRLKQVIDSEESSMTDVAEVVSLDPGLAARLLRIANSAFFGLPSQVDTITRATSILGTRQIHDLALATSVAQCFDGMPNDVLDMRTFWYRSVLCGFLARELGLAAGMRGTEVLFVQGLLHDIGHLVLYSQFPGECRHALKGTENNLALQCEMERKMIGCDAPQVGAALLKLWNLPISIFEPIECIGHPEDAKNNPEFTAILSMAAWLTHSMDTDLLALDILEKVTPWVWEKTGLNETMVEQVQEAISVDMIEAMYCLFATDDITASTSDRVSPS